jgi:hypothetical protein
MASQKDKVLFATRKSPTSWKDKELPGVKANETHQDICE